MPLLVLHVLYTSGEQLGWYNNTLCIYDISGAEHYQHWTHLTSDKEETECHTLLNVAGDNID